MAISSLAACSKSLRRVAFLAATSALLLPVQASLPQASGCECPASVGPIVPSPFAGGAGSNCYPVSIVVEAIYGTGATPLFTITNTCEDC